MARRTWLPALVVVLAASPLGAQTVAVSKLDEATYGYAVTAERRSIFAANLSLGPEERERFWKLYDDYEKEREPLEKERFALFQRYAQSYSAIGDEQAMALVLASGRLQIADLADAAHRLLDCLVISPGHPAGGPPEDLQRMHHPAQAGMNGGQ